MIIAIDGFSEADNIKEISRLGIDWIGLDFVADSPRRVRQLASLSGMLPDSPLLECAGLAPGSRLMGVFRPKPSSPASTTSISTSCASKARNRPSS